MLESASNAWHLHDQIRPLVASVTVAHPLMVKLITAARVKTDSRDVLSLARLLVAGLIPAVWVPPPEVRELRALVAHRRRLVTQRTQARNRLHSILHRHNLVPPSGNLFAAAHRSWWDGLGLPPSERLQAKQDLALLDCLQPLIKEVEAELTRLSTIEPWAAQVPYLVQLPGIGVLSAMVLLSAIGDISRFPSAKKLVGYAGLGASVHDSGQSRHTGHITKQGRKEIRHTLVEVAWAAVEHYAYWKALFGRLATRMARSNAIVAVARKLLVTVWHVLTHRQADRRAEAEKVAFKFIAWAADLGKDGRQGLTQDRRLRSAPAHSGWHRPVAREPLAQRPDLPFAAARGYNRPGYVARGRPLTRTAGPQSRTFRSISSAIPVSCGPERLAQLRYPIAQGGPAQRVKGVCANPKR